MSKQQVCPVCGCPIGEDAYEENGLLYCCEPCATQGQCECGCCEVEEEAPFSC
jgi:hypothetical protein